MSPYDQANPYGTQTMNGNTPMKTNPYAMASQQPQMGQINPYMQNTAEQNASAQMAAQSAMNTRAGIGAAAGGSSQGGSADPKMLAAALRGGRDLGNQANVASGDTYGTDFASEQSRMLAAQEQGLYR